VNGEGKGPEGKFGSGDFQEEDRKRTTVAHIRFWKGLGVKLPGAT
jgi:hypothetical protein